MRAPPVAQFGHHRRGQRHVPVLAALAVADVQPRRRFLAVDVAQLNPHRLAHAQAAMIHQPQTGAEPRFGEGGQQRLDFAAGQNDGQDLRFGDAHFLEHRPALDLEAVQVEAAQGKLGGLHGAVRVVFVLPQKQEILAQLVLGERGRVTLEMLGELADVPHVFLFGRPADNL